MRFDLVIDENLNVYLLEANMSPNLSSAHFKQNTLLYEQVIYNTLGLVGIGTNLARDTLRKGLEYFFYFTFINMPKYKSNILLQINR